ncbi:hypothetical protein ANI02nite_22720 [Acetobacter nitrogenifigens DSM 23921 = NBRC 105050]|uniref:Uncharacterized protein n=1 Tax=Acetobacter nitrogenifigens DSM 23921 = NBRC 105050 TaxID=1120919 RepID=A0A511XBQ1_9PROT|nr:hypothetical protein ANI02nite_22720 [Acetobacter nitrogenifigens DSM 23921 = NBRC 105050]
MDDASFRVFDSGDGDVQGYVRPWRAKFCQDVGKCPYIVDRSRFGLTVGDAAVRADDCEINKGAADIRA